MTGLTILGIVAIVAMVGPASWVGYVELAHPPPTWGPADVPIQHIVVIMMENHAYDSFFGTYCQTLGTYCSNTSNGIPAGTCVPLEPTDLAAGCVKPYNFTSMKEPDMPHTYVSTTEAINGGAMNGFYKAEKDKNETFGHWNGSAIPVYWDMAENFGLGDDFFSSVVSWSEPNHWYMIAGQAPALSINASQRTLDTPLKLHEYLNEANNTSTVQDLLNNTPSVSWKYYDYALESYQSEINHVQGTGAYSAWNPFQARAETYSTFESGHLVGRSHFFTDLSGPNFPNISWIIPMSNDSDHPPDNLSQGQQYVASLVDAVETSRYWKSTAIFLTWDDYGGFYDGVTPPVLDPLGLSIRVPLIVISPYTPAGVVVDQLGYFESTLHFMEWRFLGNRCLDARDCNAPLPFGYFNFNQTARAPFLFPTNWSKASYPMTSGMSLPNYHEIDPNSWNPLPGQPDSDDD
jgi:phospholipase C